MGVGVLQERTLKTEHIILRSPELGILDRGSANLFVFFISVNSLIVVVHDCRAAAVV